MPGMLAKDQVAALSTMTTTDEAGRHFTTRYPDAVLEYLESAGFISIHKPVHERTGAEYSEQYWSAEVTEAGAELVQAWPEYQVQAIDG